VARANAPAERATWQLRASSTDSATPCFSMHEKGARRSLFLPFVRTDEEKPAIHDRALQKSASIDVTRQV